MALLRELGREHGFEVVGVRLTGEDARPGVVDPHPLPGGGRGRGGRGGAAGPPPRGAGPRGPRRRPGRRPSWGSRPPTSRCPTDIALPADGIYAGYYRRPDGTGYLAAISVGRRPTFYDPASASVLVEAYLLHFEGDLYGELGRVSFVRRLRDERQFDSVDALIAQMHDDVADTERLLTAEPG